VASLRLNKPAYISALVGVAVLVCAGCAVKHTTRVAASAVPLPPVAASASELADRLQKQHDAVHTMTAIMGLEPTAGSVYSGVISQYHDVRAAVLLQSPDEIRMQGQAPVVRTSIFDMVSDGKEFKVWIPSKQKFLVGSTQVTRPAKNSLENLRPQHILDALLAPGIDSAREEYFLNQERQDAHIYYVLNIVARRTGDTLVLLRRAWFDASTLELLRVEYYDAQGAVVEDVRYSAYRDYQGVHFPSHIQLERPDDDYSLGMTVEQATFNQPIAAEKFVLNKPANAEEIRVGTASGGEGRVGQ
jgi:outer membrane lipoprotein-sorting protein